MGALLQIATTNLAVEPGRQVTTEITVRNTSSVVDRFTFEALGPLAEWVTFSPETLSLFPDASGTVTATIRPPRISALPAGPAPFGVRAASAEDPEASAAEEGTVEIGAFSDVSMELLPRLVQARRAAVARLAVDNRSNVPYEGQLSAQDPSAAVRVAFRPPVLSIPPGGAAFVRVRVAPAKTFWRGHTIHRPFQVCLSSDVAPHPQRLDVDGSLSQEALLPKWAMWLIAGLVALAALAVLLWFTVLKPQVRSTATNAAKTQLAAAGLGPSQTASAPSPSPGAAKSGNGNPGSPTSGGGGTSTVGAVGGGGSAGVTVNGSGTGSGNGNQVIYTVPPGHTLQITDLLIQNAAGDSGTLTLGRNGTALMQWAMANFRDLDYHWVSPTLFTEGSKVVMSVSGCSGACHPAVYYAGNLVATS